MKSKIRKTVYNFPVLLKFWLFLLSLRDNRHFLHRKIYNYFYFLYLNKVRGYNYLTFEKKITNGIFRIFIKENNNIIIKINKRDGNSSEKLYKKLKDDQEFIRYKETLESTIELEFIKQHTCPVFNVKRDGGYESPYIKGINIQSLKMELKEGKSTISRSTINQILYALDDLYNNLNNFYNKYNYLPGDWMPHNLIYNDLNGILINVDVEGYYNYKGFVPERLNKLHFNELRVLLRQSVNDN
jgi:hypothetical protein